jgi:hypothetical protein
LKKRSDLSPLVVFDVDIITNIHNFPFYIHTLSIYFTTWPQHLHNFICLILSCTLLYASFAVFVLCSSFLCALFFSLFVIWLYSGDWIKVNQRGLPYFMDCITIDRRICTLVCNTVSFSFSSFTTCRNIHKRPTAHSLDHMLKWFTKLRPVSYRISPIYSGWIDSDTRWIASFGLTDNESNDPRANGSFTFNPFTTL